MVSVRPQQTDEILANPGMGWQTFNCFADDDPNLEGLPTGAAYFRYYWSQIEPREGEIDFPKLDEVLAHARKAGQKLGLRIMCAAGGSNSVYYASPEWLREKGCRGFEYHRQRKAGPRWVPDLEDTLFQEAHFRLIRELGKRYDGHPDLDHVDIGSVGLWGEWHMAGTDVELPSLEARYAIVDSYLQAFPKTLKMIVLNDVNALTRATSSGCGWRADCLGDIPGFSDDDWNHMENMYPQRVKDSRSEEVWKTAPVAWETCGDMRRWVQRGLDIRYIFDYALDYHASNLNNKSAPIPEGARPEIERFLCKLGYRLLLKNLEHDPIVTPGSALNVKMEWENVGVAPPYRDNVLSFRLTDSTGKQFFLVTDTSIKGWLPGNVAAAERLTLCAEVAPGQSELALAVVDATTREPAVRLAIEGRTEDGWYPLSSVEVQGGS
ncbi:MAG: DUF4832 domain-containing protein [Armatimonadetes bacterium]|nr:DUF4832 domain-containing protein [Armatimonadota bacterium]